MRKDVGGADWPFLLGMAYIFPVWVLMTFYLQTVRWMPAVWEWYHLGVQLIAAFVLPLVIARNVRLTQGPLARGLVLAAVTAGIAAPFYLVHYSVKYVCSHRRDTVQCIKISDPCSPDATVSPKELF